jgi:hypothetical protein
MNTDDNPFKLPTLFFTVGADQPEKRRSPLDFPGGGRRWREPFPGIGGVRAKRNAKKRPQRARRTPEKGVLSPEVSGGEALPGRTLSIITHLDNQLF